MSSDTRKSFISYLPQNRIAPPGGRMQIASPSKPGTPGMVGVDRKLYGVVDVTWHYRTATRPATLSLSLTRSTRHPARDRRGDVLRLQEALKRYGHFGVHEVRRVGPSGSEGRRQSRDATPFARAYATSFSPSGSSRWMSVNILF